MNNTWIKTYSAAIILAVFSIFFLTSCEKEYGTAEEVKGLCEVKDKHLGPAEGVYANGSFALRCKDLAEVRYGGQEVRVEHYCRSTYSLHGDQLEQLDGCYELDTVTLALRGSNAYLRFEGDSAERFSVEFDGTEAVDITDRVNPCHMEAKTLCVDKAARRIRLIGTDENGEECLAEGDWYGVITVSQIVHDTVVVYDTVNNTTIITIHDTVVGVDTVIRTQELACRLISWEPIATLNTANEVVVEGHSQANLRVTENGVETLNLTTPYTVWSKWGYTGIQGVNFPDSVGNHCYTITAGNAVAGGNQIITYFVSDVVADNAVMINGSDYRSQVSTFHAKPTQWCFDGVSQVVICHFDDINAEDVALYTTPYSTAAAPVRQLVSIDTVMGGCGTASNGVFSVVTNQVTYTVTRVDTLVRHYNIAPLEERVPFTTTATYTYQVSRTGIAYQSMVSTMPVYANGSVFDFNGYTVSMVQSGNQDFCPMTLVSAVLTQSGVVITTEYNGGYPSVTIPETITPDPTPMFSGVVYACVTTSYTLNTSTTPEHWVHVLTLNNGTYTWYYTEWRSGLTVGDFTSQTITASQYAVVANAVAAGQGLAKVYHHNVGGATYELGTVKGTEQSGGQWKVKYYDLSGNLQNMMDFSASTFSGYNGENPIRGIMAANGSLTADGISIQVQ